MTVRKTDCTRNLKRKHKIVLCGEVTWKRLWTCHTTDYGMHEICMYILTCIHTYIHIHTYTHTHIHTHARTHTAEHILLECGILREERERPIAAVVKTDNWPIQKVMLNKKTPQNIRRIHENDGQNKRT